MAKLRFITLDVFTDTRFSGNPLAVVFTESDKKLTPAQKLLIAREFNLSETVFVHPSGTDGTIPIDIYITDAEIPFAGHPTIGTGYYALTHLYPTQDVLTLKTKAGLIPVSRTSEGVSLEVPTDFRIHSPFPTTALRNHLSSRLSSSDYHDPHDDKCPVVSIVKGMTFILVRLASPESLSKLSGFPVDLISLPKGWLGEWEGLVGLYAYYLPGAGSIVDTNHVQARMFQGFLEDPATGSAASALSGYLATSLAAVVPASQTPDSKHTGRFEIVQGVDMGRKSTIHTQVILQPGNLEMQQITLKGRAVEVMEGAIDVDL